MKATGIIRNVDELGRVVIPKQLRSKLDIGKSDALEIFESEGGFFLRKYVPANSCEECGEIRDDLVGNRVKVCSSCLSEMTSTQIRKLVAGK